MNRSKGSTRQNQSENPARQLSKAEKEELTAAGKCFHCKKAGHFMRDCPLRNKVKSERTGKPPGLTSFHVGLGDSTAGNLQALAEVTESNAGVDLATVGLGFDWTMGSNEAQMALFRAVMCARTAAPESFRQKYLRATAVWKRYAV